MPERTKVCNGNVRNVKMCGNYIFKGADLSSTSFVGPFRWGWGVKFFTTLPRQVNEVARCELHMRLAPQEEEEEDAVPLRKQHKIV